MKLRLVGYIAVFLMFFGNVSVFAAQSDYVTAANKYAKIAHKAFKNKNYIKAGDFYEKAYKTNNIEIYLNNAITAYLSYAFDLSNEKEYDQAIKCCEKALLLAPDNKNAKELLADIYYSRGSMYYYRAFSEQAGLDMQKSYKYSVLPEQKEQAKQKLYQIAGNTNQFSEPFIEKTSNKSIPEILDLMELKIYGETFEKLSMIERVRKLEKDVFEQNYDKNGLIKRFERLKNAILPEYAYKKGFFNCSSPLPFCVI